MKSLLFRLAVVTALALQLSGCGDRFSAKYTVELPQVPKAWISLLGDPCWRLEWLDPDGKKQSADISPGKNMEIGLPATWANPVIAWPYWPDKNLFPGHFKPAGALFPFDVSRKNLPLSWNAGIDTFFYWELTFANGKNAAKIPANFDWPRFRELFEINVLNEAVVKDPWLVDWRLVAEKTIASNFDRRRIVPEAVKLINVPVSAGRWYGTSPFSESLYFAEGDPTVFPVRPGINVWISAEGILRCTSQTWTFNTWE
jgi:hypothetical protein